MRYDGRYMGPVQFTLNHGPDVASQQRARELTEYARSMIGKMLAYTHPGVTFNGLTHNLPDGSVVTVKLLGEAGGQPQFVANIHAKRGGEEQQATPYPYLWVGARYRFEDVGGSWWENAPNVVFDSTLILEVFEPEVEQANDRPAFGTTDQLHVTTWHFQEFWFPQREHWRMPGWEGGWANGDPSLRWPENPGVWAWQHEFYEGTEWEGHASNAGVNEFWISYTDRFMYLTSGYLHTEYNDPVLERVDNGAGLMVPVGPLWIARPPKPGGPNGWRYSTPEDREMRNTPGVSFAPHDPTDPLFQDVPYPWLAVAVLDPFEGQGVLPDGSVNFPTDDRPYRAWADIHAAQAIHGVTAYGPAQVKPGEYCIKVGVYEDFCWRDKVIPPIEIKVVTGKQPFTQTQTYIVNIPDGHYHPSFGFAYGMDLCYNYSSCCPVDAARNIMFPNTYWGDAILANPMGGSRVVTGFYPRAGKAFAPYPADMSNVGAVCGYVDIDVYVLVVAPWALGYVGSENMADAVATQVADMRDFMIGIISADGSRQVLSLGSPDETFTSIKQSFMDVNPTFQFGFWMYDPFDNTFIDMGGFPPPSIGLEWAEPYEEQARASNNAFYYWELGKGGWMTETTTEFQCL